MPPTHIAVLGGGLTGLSSAFHLSRRFPTATISVFDKSPRFGGWVYSERVTVCDGHGNTAKILLERGPRTLRPQGKAVLELINLLGLRTSIMTVPKTAPAARTRFLHIPGTSGLTALPSSPAGALSSRLGRAIVRAVLSEPFRSKANLRAINIKANDDALEHFLAIRLGPELARTLGSALVHGIYAADSRLLSVRAAFPSLWEAASRGKGSIVRGMLARSTSSDSETDGVYNLGDIQDLMQDTSVYSFRDGMLTLVQAMTAALERQDNVRLFKDNAAVALVKLSREGPITIHSQAGGVTHVSHVVSAVPLPCLKSILQRSSLPPLPHVDANLSSSVTVVNLVFPPTPPNQPIHPEGFGYLIPRAADGHVEVLGTVFDSCTLSAQDEYLAADAPKFTKMTMMYRSDTSLPAVSAKRAVDHLTRHLQPPTALPDPVFFQAHTMQNCIPAPTVGHVQRMEELKQAAWRAWDGRLEVIGAGVGGVSVADCVEQGRQAGKSWQ